MDTHAHEMSWILYLLTPLLMTDVLFVQKGHSVNQLASGLLKSYCRSFCRCHSSILEEQAAGQSSDIFLRLESHVS